MSTPINPGIWNAAGLNITAGRLITDAYRALGVLRPGQTTSDDSYAEGLSVLNDMLDSWNTESLMVPVARRDIYPLTAGQSVYTLGPSGTLKGERPVRVSDAALSVAGSTPEICTHLDLLTAQEQCGSCQCGIYIDAAIPNANVRIFPPPPAGMNLALVNWQALYGFADLETAYSFAPGYPLALRWNLALQLAPLAQIVQKIPQPLYNMIESRAMESKGAVKSLHSAPPPVMRSDLHRGIYNIYTDSYR